jgi:hypothetical protein
MNECLGDFTASLRLKWRRTVAQNDARSQSASRHRDFKFNFHQQFQHLPVFKLPPVFSLKFPCACFSGPLCIIMYGRLTGLPLSWFDDNTQHDPPIRIGLSQLHDRSSHCQQESAIALGLNGAPRRWCSCTPVAIKALSKCASENKTVPLHSQHAHSRSFRSIVGRPS